jgi:hypothetical protein
VYLFVWDSGDVHEKRVLRFVLEFDIDITDGRIGFKDIFVFLSVNGAVG